MEQPSAPPWPYAYPPTSEPQPPLAYASPAPSAPLAYASPATSIPPMMYANPAPTVPPPMMYANPAPSVPAPMAYGNPTTAIISPQFCCPYPVDLGIVRKVLTITDGNFIVTDVNGNTVFKVKGVYLSLRDRRTLLDAAGYPIVTLQKKLLSAHERWQVFRGESTESRNLVFSVKQSSMMQLKTKLDVFLGNNTKEHAPDFRVKGSWFERSCVIYAGNSSTIVAQMHKKHTVTSVLFGKDNFMVTVYPSIDYAFIIALIVILDEINASNQSSKKRSTNRSMNRGLT